MTNGEKMIWAAAFVRSFGERTDHPPSDILDGTDAARDAWMRQHAVGAMKDAAEVLACMRDAPFDSAALADVYETRQLVGDDELVGYYDDMLQEGT